MKKNRRKKKRGNHNDVVKLKGNSCVEADTVDDLPGVDDAKELPTLMFTRDGYVQFHVQGDQRGMIMARNRETAKQYAAWVQKREGTKITVADIDAVQGSTLERQLAASLKEGANCAFVIRSIEGETIICDVLLPPGVLEP